MGDRAKRVCLSAEAYAARAEKSSSDEKAVYNYYKAIQKLTSESDTHTVEERIALARAYMTALVGRMNQAGDDDSDSDSERTPMDNYSSARLAMAWVLSATPVLDFDEINKWLARVDGDAYGDLYKDFYTDIAWTMFADRERAFTDRALSIYQAHFRILPGSGAIWYALGLLSRVPVDANVFADVVNALSPGGKRLLTALVHADTRAKFEHTILRYFDDYVKLNMHARFSALMDHRFGPADD